MREIFDLLKKMPFSRYKYSPWSILIVQIYFNWVSKEDTLVVMSSQQSVTLFSFALHQSLNSFLFSNCSLSACRAQKKIRLLVHFIYFLIVYFSRKISRHISSNIHRANDVYLIFVKFFSRNLMLNLLFWISKYKIYGILSDRLELINRCLTFKYFFSYVFNESCQMVTNHNH